MVRHVRMRGRGNDDGQRTGINPACYVYEVHSSGLSRLCRFCRFSPDVPRRGGDWAWRMFGCEGLIDGASCPREGKWRLTKIRLKSIFPID
jgi:hypothetical protein